MVWMVSILLIFSYSILFSGSLGTVPRTLTTIGITVISTFHNLFSSLARSKYLIIFSFSFVPMNIMSYFIMPFLYSVGVRIGQMNTKWSIDSVFVHTIYTLGLYCFLSCLPDSFLLLVSDPMQLLLTPPSLPSVQHFSAID